MIQRACLSSINWPISISAQNNPQSSMYQITNDVKAATYTLTQEKLILVVKWRIIIVNQQSVYRWSTKVNLPSMLWREINSLELVLLPSRSLLLGELVTWRRPIATRHCVTIWPPSSPLVMLSTWAPITSITIKITTVYRMTQCYCLNYVSNYLPPVLPST